MSKVTPAKLQQSSSRNHTTKHYTMLQNEETFNSLLCCLRNTLPYIHAEFYSILGSNVQSMLQTLPYHAPLGLPQALDPSYLFHGKPSVGN